MTRAERIDAFLALSARLTAFRPFELRGTGQAEAYLDTVERVVGEADLEALLGAHRRIESQAAREGAPLDPVLRREILSDDRLGPIARNVIKLWYVAIWYELPKAWRDAYGARDGDFTHTVSAEAYTEALLWPAVGANPSGAKAPGYGSWAEPPRIPDFGIAP